MDNLLQFFIFYFFFILFFYLFFFLCVCIFSSILKMGSMCGYAVDLLPALRTLFAKRKSFNYL